MESIIFPQKLFTVRKDRVIEVIGTRETREAHYGEWLTPGRYQRWVLVAELSDLAAWLGRRELNPPQLFTINGDRSDVDFQYHSLDDNYGDVAGWRYRPRPGQRAKLEMAIVEVLIIND